MEEIKAPPSLAFQTQIGVLMKITNNQLVVMYSHMHVAPPYGGWKNEIQYLFLQLILKPRLCVQVSMNQSGFIFSLKESHAENLIPSLFLETIKVR
jgi:hypothetical protein